MRKFALKPVCMPPIFGGSPVEAAEMERRRKELPIRVVTGLGSDIDRYVSQSKTFREQLLSLQSDNWKIVWGPAGKGSVTDQKRFLHDGKIIIDSSFRTGKSVDIAYVSSIIAHEIAHAYFHKKPNLSSFSKCMESFMIGPGSEADAIINQITIQKEIKSETCIDIFAEGREYDFMKVDFVNFYNEGFRMRNMKSAKVKIAERYSEQYTSNSNPPQKYKDYYADYCRKNAH